MNTFRFRHLSFFSLSLVLFCNVLIFAQESDTKTDVEPKVDLSDFRTVETARTAEIQRNAPTSSAQNPYLGVHLEVAEKGELKVELIAADSPAEKAGVKHGDVVLKLDGQAVKLPDEFRQALLAKSPSDEVTLAISRDGKQQEIKTKLAATSRPLRAGRQRGQRGFLGVRVEPSNEPKGTRIEQVVKGSAAEKAGLNVNDVIVKINDAEVGSSQNLVRHLYRTKPGEKITLLLQRGEEEKTIDVKLGSNAPQPSRSGRQGSRYWSKDVYRLAIIGVEYPDQKHNEKVSTDDWTEAIFSEGTYASKQSVTGQPVHGSVNDYYREISAGAFHIEGKVFDWVEVEKKRDEYSTGNRSALLVEATTHLLERDGDDALKDFDGIFFLYAGGRVRTSRGGLYWPHRGSFSHGRRRWPYFIMQEGGSRMSNISVMCHEFGHMLGLPDLYSKDATSEGLSVWCAMSNQAGNGRPQHFSAWCKEQLGWLKPAVIDPAVKQKLILGPVERSSNECFKVLARPDGSEYFLLENRRQFGFDASLPSDGLLIWRVVNNRPVLEESHGIAGPAGPSSSRDVVPYPSGSNNSFTPYTTPSSRSTLGGQTAVQITNIRELPDGRITFYIGYDFQ